MPSSPTGTTKRIERMVDYMLITSGINIAFGFITMFLNTGFLPVILFVIGSTLGFSSALLYGRIQEVESISTIGDRGN